MAGPNYLWLLMRNQFYYGHYGLSLAQVSAQQKTTTKHKKKQEKITEKKLEQIFLKIVTKNVRKESVLSQF